MVSATRRPRSLPARVVPRGSVSQRQKGRRKRVAKSAAASRTSGVDATALASHVSPGRVHRQRDHRAQGTRCRAQRQAEVELCMDSRSRGRRVVWRTPRDLAAGPLRPPVPGRDAVQGWIGMRLAAVCRKEPLDRAARTACLTTARGDAPTSSIPRWTSAASPGRLVGRCLESDVASMPTQSRPYAS